MGEALLIKTGGGSVGGSTNSSQNITSNGLITEIFTSNTLWRVPENLRNNQVSVRLFGGGSAGNALGGGCGGTMVNRIINMNNVYASTGVYENAIGKDIYIIIGSGGKWVNGFAGAGGTTSFGKYVSAHGANIYSGSSGGGGLSLGGRDGLQFGGGGGAGVGTHNNYTGNSIGGNGGTWGGGGGSGVSSSSVTIGGCYNGNSSNTTGNGGNGGTRTINAENGVNTIGMGLEFEGIGSAGQIPNTNRVGCCGGGGYGGNGGNGGGYNTSINNNIASSGGGGGYGARGGGGYLSYYNTLYGGGGGGGYGGNGGRGYMLSAGGGGGYGVSGSGGAIGVSAGIAAGGYGCCNTHNNNATASFNESCAHGGDGICIIQYYLD